MNGRNRESRQETDEVLAEPTDDLNSGEAKFFSLTSLSGFRASAENVIPLDLSVSNFKLLQWITFFLAKVNRMPNATIMMGIPFTEQCYH